MPNYLQKLIYNFAAIIPLLFIFSIVWVLQTHTFLIPLVCTVCALVFWTIFEISFAYANKHIPPIGITVVNLSPYDSWIVVYIITYIFPFVSLVLKDFNLIMAILLSSFLIVILPFVNSSIPNPLLFLKGYHFYKIESNNGVSEYILISRRKLRKTADLRYVKRLSEFLLLDEEKRK